MKHVKIDENYYLTTQPVNSSVTVQVAKQTNHIFVVDVSGSMSWQLQFIRTQLKNKLSNIMKDGDTITIIWFSGSRDAGILKEEIEVRSLKTLSDLNDAIDRWLRPVGMTAFLKPLQLTKEVIGRIKANRPNGVFSLIFLTDGYNNDCPWADVKTALKNLEQDIALSTFVEYGYYADSQKLTEMAAIMGGEKISCDGFDEFEPVFDKKISTGQCGGKKILVNVGMPMYDLAYSITADGSVMLYNVTNGEIMVSDDVKEVHYFTLKSWGEPEQNLPFTALYAGAYVLSDKLMNDDAEKLFYVIGDNFYYKMLANAFGKQKLNAFKSSIKECIADVTKRYPEGMAKINKVDDNAYCLMNLIDDLGSREDCLFYPNHEDFNYNRIGRKKVAVGSKLTDDDQKRLSEAKNVAEMIAIGKELEDKKLDLEFINTNPYRGYALNSLVWNKSRANLSVLCKIDGTAKLPVNKYSINEVASFKFNTFTLIKDGILNVSKLPVNYNLELEKLLISNGVQYTLDGDVVTGVPEYIIIDLSSIPIVNKGMIKAISANELAKQEWQLVKFQAQQKVYDYYRKSLFPKESKSFAELLGQECADWLKEIGITDYNGFAPKVESVPSTDFYMSVNLNTKIKGLSSLPKVEDVIKKMTDANAVLKTSEWLMAGAIKEYALQLDSEIYKLLDADAQKEVLKNYIITKSDELNKLRRGAIKAIAKIKFSLILSKKNFIEFKTFDDNKLTLNLDGQVLDFSFEYTEEQELI